MRATGRTHAACLFWGLLAILATQQARSEPRASRNLIQDPSLASHLLQAMATGPGSAPRPPRLASMQPAAASPLLPAAQQLPPGRYIAAQSGSWGSADTWSTGEVPPPGSSVTIPASVTVTLAASAGDASGDVVISVDTLAVEGTLQCGEGQAAIEIAANMVLVLGQFVCGAPGAPFPGRLTITLSGGRGVRGPGGQAVWMP